MYVDVRARGGGGSDESEWNYEWRETPVRDMVVCRVGEGSCVRVRVSVCESYGATQGEVRSGGGDEAWTCVLRSSCAAM